MRRPVREAVIPAAGDKLHCLRATVELAIDRPDLGPQFRAFLADLVQRKKLVGGRRRC